MQKRMVALVSAVALGVGAGVVGTQLVSGAGESDESVFISNTPCRLVDTRSGDDNVGPVSSPIGPDATVLFNAHDGKDGDSPCEIPASATAISANVVAVRPTVGGFLTLFPGGVSNPGTANLNFVAGQAPTPNAAVIPLGADGGFNVFNAFGTVNVVIDVSGFYQPSSSIGGEGPAGPAGPQGPAGGVDTGHSRATVDDGGVGDVGTYTSAAIGTDGNPIISYFDNTNDDLKVAACTNPTCTTTPIFTAVDVAGSVGFDTSITVGTDGNPVISYFDNTNGDLKVAACTNPTCTASTITPVDTVGVVGEYTSIAIGSGGNPVISYRDVTNGHLKVAACTNPTCTASTTTPVDTVGVVGQYTSITVGSGGNPVISYFDITNGDLKVAACTNPTCTAAATITPVDTANSVGFDTSITIGSGGNPVISYYDGTNGDLKVAACTNPTCTAATITPVDTVGLVGLDTSITIGTDGNPIISYSDGSNADLKVAACTNPTCTAATITAVDTNGGLGQFTSIVLGIDTKPVIANYDSTNDDLRVVVCGNTTCAPYTGNTR